MSRAIKSLADGQLATSKGTLYTAPTSKQAIVTGGRFNNTTTSTVTVKIYFKKSGGTSRRIDRFEIPPEGKGILNDEITLEAADILEGEADVGTAIDYKISGVENS